METSLEKRVETWSNFAMALYEMELEAYSKLDEVKEACNFPVSTENIEEAEKTLKVIKSTIAEIKDMRLSKTTPLDNLKQRLMTPEKDAAEQLKYFESNLLEVKKEIAEAQRKLELVENQKREYAEFVKSFYIDFIRKNEADLRNGASRLYSDMLDKKVDTKKFDEEVNGCANTFNIPSIKEAFEKAVAPSTPDLTKQDKALIYTKNKMELPNYTKMFIEKMNVYKAGYAAELNNIEESKKRLEEEKKAAEKRAAELKAAQELEAKLSSVPTIKEPAKGKQVKEVYVVDMEEDLKNAMTLYACLSANLDLILPKLRVKKWFDLKPNQIATVLGKLKSENNSLEFEGITFTKEYKL